MATSIEVTGVEEQASKQAHSEGAAGSQPDRRASSHFGCVGNTIRCASGAYLDFANPQAHQIDLEDIAIGLANECRFARQSPRFYSVAEHSIECAKYASRLGLRLETVRNVFAHDFAEAYIGDVPKPLKIMLPELRQVEAAIEEAICERFCELQLDLRDPVIKTIDWTLLFAERNAIFGKSAFSAGGEYWPGEDQVPALDLQLRCLAPDEAALEFLAMARDLGFPVGK